MSKRQYPLIYAKVPACLMHIAAVIIALIGISLMYLNNNFGKGLESLSIESYEDTPGSTNSSGGMSMIFSNTSATATCSKPTERSTTQSPCWR